MVTLAAYEEILRAFSESVEEAQAALARQDYAALAMTMSRQDALLHHHARMLEDLASVPDGLPPSMLAATTEMARLLGHWAEIHPLLTESLRQAREETREKLEHLSRGRQLIHTYHPHATPRSRFVDKRR